jgi:hypothetical protein
LQRTAGPYKRAISSHEFGYSGVGASPCAEGLEHRSKGFPFRGQEILVTWEVAFIEPGGDHTLRFQHLETRRQGIGRSPASISWNRTPMRVVFPPKPRSRFRTYMSIAADAREIAF